MMDFLKMSKKKRNGNLKIFVSMMASALSIAWALIFRDYIVEKLKLVNFLGIATDIWLLAVIGGIIFVLSYFGVIRK